MKIAMNTCMDEFMNECMDKYTETKAPIKGIEKTGTHGWMGNY